MVRLLRGGGGGGGGEHGMGAHGGAARAPLRRAVALRLGGPRGGDLRLLAVGSPPPDVLLVGGVGGELAVGGAGGDTSAAGVGAVSVYLS